MEGINVNQRQAFLADHNHISSSQYGFQKGVLQLFNLLTITQIGSPHKTDEKPLMLFSWIM